MVGPARKREAVKHVQDQISHGPLEPRVLLDAPAVAYPALVGRGADPEGPPDFLHIPARSQHPAGLAQLFDDFFSCVSLSFHEIERRSRAANSHNSWLSFRGVLQPYQPHIQAVKP